MKRRSAVLFGIAVAAASGFLAASRLARTSSVSEVRFSIVQRPAEPVGPDEAGLDGSVLPASRYRWTADRIRTEWDKVVTANGLTFRTPRLDLEGDELHAIVATLRAASGTPRALLLWNDRDTLSGEEYLRNRWDLRPQADRPSTLTIRGKHLRGDGTYPRYLFLQVSDPVVLDTLIETVTVVRTADLTAVPGGVRARLMLNGEVRDVVATSTSSSLSYSIDATPRAELSFGLELGGASGTDGARGVTGRARVKLGSGGTEHVLFDEVVHGGQWRDVRVPLPPAGRAVVTLSVASADAATPVYWAPPVVLAPSGGADRPNVIIYVVDALRADRIGAYGGPATRALDDLARRGRVFDHAYAAASWTKPSVTSLLTSLAPETHGLGAHYYSDPLPNSVPTLQSALRAAGYVTALFSANPMAGTLSNLDRGFDAAFMPEAFAAPPTPTGRGKITARAINDRLLPWIDAHARDRFFLYVQSLDVHPPYTEPDGALAPHALPAYDAAIAEADAEIGRLYEHLVLRGLSSRTLLIITADHGEAFGEHGRSGHGQSVYEEEMRVPLIMHWPGRVPPGRWATPVQLLDLAPTVLDYCAIDIIGGFQGRSLARPAGEGEAGRPIVLTRFLYPEARDLGDIDREEAHAVVQFPWKLIATDLPNGTRRLELYHLADDPLERHDRAAAESDRAARLNAVLGEYLQRQARARARFVAEHGGTGQTGAGVTPMPSRQVLDQLRSLGYIR